MNDRPDAHQTLTLLLMNQQQIHENIKFADQKAAAITALNTALMGGIFGLAAPAQPGLTQLLLPALALLVLGIVTSVCVLWPRGGVGRRRGRGLIDAGRIAQFSDASAFVAACRGAADGALLDEARTFVFDRATIDRRKYRWLRVSLVLSGIGWLLALAYAGCARFGVDPGPVLRYFTFPA